MNQTCESTTFDFCCPAFDTTIYITKNGNEYLCLNGTIVRHYNQLELYYICVDGKKILSGTCDQGYTYCEASKRCYMENIETCSLDVNDNSPNDPFPISDGIWVSQAPWAVCPKDSSNFNDPNDCTSYYNCSSGTPNLYKCPDDYVYDCFNDVCSTYSNRYCCPDTSVKSSLLLNTNVYTCKSKRITYVDGVDNVYLECFNNNILTGDCGVLR